MLSDGSLKRVFVNELRLRTFSREVLSPVDDLKSYCVAGVQDRAVLDDFGADEVPFPEWKYAVGADVKLLFGVECEARA